MRRSGKSILRSRWCIGWGAVQDSQGKAESGHIHGRRAETGVGPAGAERQMQKGANPSALFALCRRGDSRMKAAAYIVAILLSLWFAPTQMTCGKGMVIWLFTQG